jgi:hypothetical protein
MTTALLRLALAASLLGLGACSHPDQTAGAIADNQAGFAQARAAAKTSTLQAISADHQTKINAVVASFNSGSLASPDAAKAIDAILSPTETSAVLAQQVKMRSSFRSGHTQGGSPSGFSGRHRAPDAGRFLLQLLGTHSRSGSGRTG